MPFLFYVSGSRRTSARGDAAHRNKPARARGARKPRRGDPFRGVGGALLSPPRRNTTNFAASDRALSDVCFYVGFSFSQKVLRYFLGALKCLVPFLFYASGSRRTIARRDAALRDKCARARGVRKPRRGAPFRGVGGALLSPPRRNTTNFAASDRTPVGCLLLRRFLLFPKSSPILFGSPEMPCALSFLCVGKPADNCQSGQLPYRNKKM